SKIGSGGSSTKKTTRQPVGFGHREIAKILQGGGYAHDRHRVFRDCIEMMAIALSNAVDLVHREAREARYLEIVRRYKRDEIEAFCRVLAVLTNTLDAGPADVLGAAFGELEVHNKDAGQFFTPFEVCRLMAGLMVGDGEAMRAKVASEGFVLASEPAVGAGAMVIALAEAMQNAGLNYQRHLHVTAVDVDARAAHMAYIQFSLLHIPAIVIVGNSITLETRETWYTPAHILGAWSRKLELRDAKDRARETPAATSPIQHEAPLPAATATAQRQQLVLF
ncbi:MAG: hypothetical protein RL684_842, partial [Pseudomonadota bacterium]